MGEHLALKEFAYNNNYYSCIEMEPFEAVYSRQCRSLIGWFETSEVRPCGTESSSEDAIGDWESIHSSRFNLN